jgi:hypothetical protein
MRNAEPNPKGKLSRALILTAIGNSMAVSSQCLRKRAYCRIVYIGFRCLHQNIQNQ